MSTIKYVKKANKSKVAIYILRDFDGNIIDLTKDNRLSEKYFESNGNEITNAEYVQLDYLGRARIKIVPVNAVDEGYEKEHPFIFDAEFEVIGSGGGKSYDALNFNLIDGPKVQNEYEWQTGSVEKVARKFAITTHNYCKLLKLIKDKHPDFSYIIRQNYDPTHWNNLEVKGYRGRWVFEFNKHTLAVKPYVEKEG